MSQSTDPQISSDAGIPLVPVSVTPVVSEYIYDPTLPEHQPWCVEAPPVRNRMILTDLTVDIPESTSKAPAGETEGQNLHQHPKARWRTLEFRIYIAVLCLVLPIMVWIPISLSLSSSPNYQFYKNRLSPGWIPFRQVDNSDAQYRGFRNNFWLLTFLANAYLFIKFIWVTSARSPPDNNVYLIRYNLACSLLFLTGLHGSSILKILFILTLNFLVARLCKGSKAGPVLTWVFNAAVLFANDRWNGYRFGDVLPSLAFLDGYQGAYARWHIIFNLTMLRLVSFNMDYYWACHAKEFPEYRYHRTTTTTERKASHPPHMYHFVNYVSYVLYPPLYIAGPIMGFNDYLWQHRKPMHIYGRVALLYFFRLIASLVSMELILHFMYVVAIKDTKAWVNNSPAQICMIGFWNLIIVWLKLLIPWRFFRLWAIMDGIEVPENMVRCMANNYSTLGFWRSWHRSYNLWIIRYIYIPLGGSRRLILNTTLVFTFVALWHDLTFRLLAWGWLVSLFILPEIIATYLLPASKYGTQWWYRHVCALGGVVNVLMMMGANLVGFVIGTDGIQFFVRQLFGTTEGLLFFGTACGCLFVGVQLMFEYRACEPERQTIRFQGTIGAARLVATAILFPDLGWFSPMVTSFARRYTPPLTRFRLQDTPKEYLFIDFLIVGGGLAGLACAVALRRVGHRVVVVEEDASMSTQNSGGCRMAPNLTKILNHWGLQDKVSSIALRSQAIDLLLFETGEVLGSHVWAEEMLRDARGEFYFCHYGDLRKLLYDAAIELGVTVHLGTRVTSVDPEERIVELVGGQTLTADVIVGADGINGKCRQHFDIDELEPGSHNLVMYSTTIPQSEIMKDKELAPYFYGREFRSMFSWFGNGRSSLGFPLGGNSEEKDFALFVYGPPDGNEGDWATEAPVSGMRRILNEAAEPRLRKLGALARKATCIPTVEYPEVEDWIHDSGRLVLIGEAVHPHPPGAIQSCAMAIEDGAVLAKLFSHLRSEDQITNFLYAFENLRQQRCVASTKKEFGDIFFMTLPLGEMQAGRDMIMRTKRDQGRSPLEGSADGEETQEWTEIKVMFGYDAEDEADNWWQEWGVLRERAQGRDVPFESFGNMIVVEQQVG
ncbi:hypothetical protein DXG03_001589 [Asterophora parasitica]|uniref:FAD-binding domain-containing protein n=1 Tax=Asterophora parasitica TaxID=117018 RepID=A0A9P7KA87_9AGAR|nr:hypothetical protein DXG03_001589 [Asterophora parasitica]